MIGVLNERLDPITVPGANIESSGMKVLSQMIDCLIFTLLPILTLSQTTEDSISVLVPIVTSFPITVFGPTTELEPNWTDDPIATGALI